MHLFTCEGILKHIQLLTKRDLVSAPKAFYCSGLPSPMLVSSAFASISQTGLFCVCVDAASQSKPSFCIMTERSPRIHRTNFMNAINALHLSQLLSPQALNRVG